MKKIKYFVVVVLIGSMLGFISFNESKDIIETNTVAFQLGVFKNEENAIKLKERLGGIVIKDIDVYRVYYAVLHNRDNIKFIKDFLEEQNISYYIKNIDLDKTNILKSDKYEILMNNTRKNRSKLEVNNKILKFYAEVL